MRITIVTGPFYPTPPAPTGAVQRRWSDVAGFLAREGHEVTILACRYAGQLKEERRADGVRVRRRTSFKQSPRIKIDLIKDLWYSKRMLMLAPKADVLVTNSFWMPVVARLRRGIGKIWVNVARMPKGQMKLYRHASRLHAVSNAVAEAIIQEQPSLAPKVRVIPNPIDTHVFAPAPEQSSTRRANGIRTILYTGRIHPEKGLELLIKAFAKLNPAVSHLRLRLMGASSIGEGGGGEEYVRSLKNLAGDLPIEICDPVYGREALVKQMHAADFYVYPSLAEKGESFGVAPLEAMATGLAPIVSNLDCFKDFITHDRTGLIFDHRCDDPVQALVHQMRRLIGDDAMGKRIGSTAATEAKNFGYEHVAKRLLAEFQAMLDER